MSQNNIRKEPTFGEPSNSASTENLTETVKAEVADAAKAAANAKVSLHSTSAPSYTFTPVMKRPVTSATEFKTIEEAQAVNTNNPTPNTEAPKVPEAPKQSANFAFSPVAEKAETVAEEAVKTVEKAAEKVEEKANTIERVIPAAAAKAQPGKTEKATKSPSSARRLGLVAVLLVVLGAIFFWLKPSAPETVEELQSQQGNSLPIEFRPVDEEEAKRAEAQAKAEQEALAQQQAQAQQQAADQTQSVATDPNAPAQPATDAAQTAPVENGAQPITIKPITADQAQPATDAAQTETAVAPKPALRVEKAKVAEKPKATQPKPADKPRIKAITADEFNAKKARNAQLDQLVKNVEEGKPAVAPKPVAATKPAAIQAPAKPVVAQPAAKVAAPAPAAASVSSKTMTVPKSTSLMQVFRDNGLNISDVNAMSKVNNVVSNLKVGERVTVRLDKNNRVVEMNIGSGGKFTRQADGSYSFK